MSEEIAADYVSSLADLTVNSKPHINMLTMLADDNVEHAAAIVKAVEKHLEKVPSDTKLPVLYLIDSIIKNVGRDYKTLFAQNIANTFCNAFEKVDEKTRANLFKLRQTWNDVIPSKKLYLLDTKVNIIDPAWPITATPPKIHLNPRFLNSSNNSPSVSSPTSPAPLTPVTPISPALSTDAVMMEQLLLQKQKKLIELKQEKLRLELLQTQAQLDEQQKMLEKKTGHLKLLSEKSQQKKNKLESVQIPTQTEEQKKQPIKQSIDPSSTPIRKLMQKITNKDTNKIVNRTPVKNGNSSVAQVLPSKTPAHVENSPKIEPKTVLSTSKTESPKGNSKFEPTLKPSIGKGGDALLKPYATAELNLCPSTSKKSSPKPSKSVKSLNVRTDFGQLSKLKFQAIQDKREATSDLKIVHAVLSQPRIAPVSSQLISAARRQTRDPRILRRQMEEPMPEHPPKPHSPPKIELSPKIKQKSAIEEEKIKSQSKQKDKEAGKQLTYFKSKSKKDKKSSRHSREEKQHKMYQIVKDFKTKSQVTDKLQSKKEKKEVDEEPLSTSQQLMDSLLINKSKSPVPENVEKLNSPLTSDKQCKNDDSEKLEVSKQEVNKNIDLQFKSDHSSLSEKVEIVEQNDLKKDVQSSLPLSLPTKESPPPPPVITEKFEKTKSASLSRIRKYVRNREGSESPPITEIDLQKEPIIPTRDSTPPPPIISDKFKEMKPASLSRLRKYVRNREGSESPPITGDVDLRHVMPPLSDDHKKEVVGNEAVSTEKDVDLRQFSASPTKKRPSVERSEAPPPKKSKAEVFDELFGKEDVDLRTLPPPSPPPPPVISLISTEEKENGTERSWAKYKQQKPDTFKSPYRYTHLKSPSFNKKGSAVPPNWRAKTKPYPSKDTDMRHQFGPGSNYDIIIKQAHEQYNSGSLTDNDYKKIVTEVISMNEIRQVEEAQRLDEEELRKEEEYEELEPISDDEMNSYSESHNFSQDKDNSSLNTDDSTLPTGNETDISNQNEENKHEMVIDIKDKLEESVETLSTDIERRRYSDNDKNNKTTKPLSDSHSPRFREDVGHQRDDISESDRKRYHRDRERRDEHRYRHEQKLRRRTEVRESRMFRKNRYGQAEQEVWETPPFEGRHTDSKIPIEMEHSGLGSFNPSDLPKPVVLDKGNFGDGEIVMNMDITPNLPLHPLRFGNDSNADTHETSRPTVPWEPTRLPSPWIRNIPPLMRPLPLMRPPLDIQRFGPNRWRAPLPPNIPLRQPFEGDNNIRFNRFPILPNSGSPRPQTLAPGELPPADPHVLELIAADPTNCINIDGKSKDIRFYGDTAVAMMEWDDPREVSFQGGQRRIIVDDRDSMLISFNSPYRDMLIDGQPHRIRFGAPTRELYIDGKWYECFFGGPPISIEISGKMRTVQLEGPPPQVRTSVQRKDLVVGKVRLIVDAKYIFDLYLDPKPQRFDIEGTPIILRFVEALWTLVINGISFKSDFGGLPKPFILKGKKHFFRLTTLPQGVKPGYLTISHMEGGRRPSPTPSGALPAPPQIPLSLQNIDIDIEPESSSDNFVPSAPPPVNLPMIVSPDPNEKSENTKDISEVLHHPSPNTSKNQLPPPVPVNPLDMLASLLPPAAVSRTSSYSYSVEAEQKEVPAANPAPPVAFGSSSFLSGEVNVAELLQKLIATGIVSNVTNTQDATTAKEKPADSDAVLPVDFNKPETLKTKQSGMVTSFYSGIQCSSCGVRFPPEQTMKYSQHLDWHFRQNRRDKDSARMAQSRKWYYDISDWIQFEEIEDLEDRAQSWFESQAGQNSNSAEAEEPPGEVPSVAAGESPEDAACEICRDKFEQFYNEEREEWHLRQAIRVDDKLYHPICYQDYRASLDAPIEVSLDESEDNKDNGVPELEKTAPVVEQVDVDDDDLEVIECEIIQPVFPIEDLTTSDCESVVDATETKIDPITGITDEEKEKEISDASNMEKRNEEISPVDKNEGNHIAEVIIEDKEEDLTIDVEAVVKNIKQEPLDDEIMDSEVAMKKVREQIDMPEPVVDTTHVAVECSIDGNLQFDDSPQIAVIAPPKIKINITKPISTQSTIDKDINESDTSNSEVSVPTPSMPLSVFKTIVETQPPPPGEEPGPLHLKPRLLGKKLQDLPQLSKGSELSGLCSIM